MNNCLLFTWIFSVFIFHSVLLVHSISLNLITFFICLLQNQNGIGKWSKKILLLFLFKFARSKLLCCLLTFLVNFISVCHNVLAVCICTDFHRQHMWISISMCHSITDYNDYYDSSLVSDILNIHNWHMVCNDRQKEKKNNSNINYICANNKMSQFIDIGTCTVYSTLYNVSLSCMGHCLQLELYLHTILFT